MVVKTRIVALPMKKVRGVHPSLTFFDKFPILLNIENSAGYVYNHVFSIKKFNCKGE